MTNGEKWHARNVARLAAYCASRGYRIRGIWETHRAPLAHAKEQSHFEIEDRAGTRVEISGISTCDGLEMLTDAGRTIAKLSAALFDELTPTLRPADKPSKRQLSFAF